MYPATPLGQRLSFPPMRYLYSIVTIGLLGFLFLPIIGIG